MTPRMESTLALIMAAAHLHRNVPGVMAEINSVFRGDPHDLAGRAFRYLRVRGRYRFRGFPPAHTGSAQYRELADRRLAPSGRARRAGLLRRHIDAQHPGRADRRAPPRIRAAQ